MMISFERTRDYELVRQIVTHPQVWRSSLVRDSAPARDLYAVREDENIWYLAVHEHGAPVGVFFFVDLCPGLGYAEVHLAMLPPAWGRTAEICRAGIEWLRAHSPFRMLLAAIPAYNRLAVKLARQIMRPAGVQRASVAKDGQLYDQILFQVAIQ